MRARTTVVVGPDGRLSTVACEPPLTVRQLRSRDRDTCALCVVGTAAGPLPGDDLTLALTLDPGASATLQATGAQIAQGRHRDPQTRLYYGYVHPEGAEMDVPVVKMPPARVRYEVVVGAGARLVADPGALVVAASGDVEVDVRIDLAADAGLEWRETLVLGRSGEAAGRVVLRWDVRRGGSPLLRQDLDLADPALRGWDGTHAGAKIITTTLRVGPGLDARTEVRSPTDVTQRLTHGATLTTTFAPELRR